jgi:hypothetical protein
MSYPIIFDDIVITPELAAKWLANDAFANQRFIRPKDVAVYTKLMMAGLWEPGSIIEFCVFDDKRVMVNGQHRLSAVVRSGCPQRFIIKSNHVASMEDAVRIYTVIDKNIVRGLYDDFRAHNYVERFDLTATQLTHLSAAVSFIQSGFLRASQKGFLLNERVALMEEHLAAYREFLNATEGCGKVMTSRLSRAATLIVGLTSFRYSSEVYDTVDAFWRGVANDDGLSASDPRKYCVRHLLLVGMTGGGSTSANFSSHQHASISARRIAGYFNAWVEQRNLKQDVKVLNYLAPIKILGSPFEGG